LHRTLDTITAVSGAELPPSRWFDLSGRGALVTGAGAGIGRAIAARLAEAGAAVVVADVDRDGSSATVEAIRSAGGRAIATVADVRDAAAASATARLVAEEFGRLDILVNNAGLYPRSPVLDTAEETWDRVVDVNLKGTFLWSQACARVMVAAGAGGSIVNLASKQALRGGADLAHYSASKAGVVLFTQSLAVELGPHDIRVNALAPGPVATDRALQAAAARGSEKEGSPDQPGSEDGREAYRRRIPLRRFSDPDDVARVALFLASDAARMMTGSLVVVDGGASLT
jgi:NAD(P)-dependent dehydrogenase (short-subunit alcohol dehydrogenase family)